MVSFKPTPNLILMAFAAMQIAHAAPSTTVDVSIKDNDPEPGKPDHPLFACGMFSPPAQVRLAFFWGFVAIF